MAFLPGLLPAIDRADSADPIDSPDADEMVEKSESFLDEPRRPPEAEDW